MKTTAPNFTRREFLKTTSTAVAAAALAPTMLHADEAASPARKMIGIQVGAVSFLDEGTEQVLDILQQRGAVNTVFLAAFTYGRGIAGRQVPGQPLPDHGKQEYDLNFHGGNFATPHAQFYTKTNLKPVKAPDYGDYDLLADVTPKAHQRGMKAYAWFEDNFGKDMPGVENVREVELSGNRASTLCPLNPDYREFLIGLTNDFCQSYELDGVMWGSERQGPLLNAIGAKTSAGDPLSVTCFCDFHQQAAKARGVDVARAKEGYDKLAKFMTATRAGNRPNDGYFVEFWRLLLDYPELLAWEKLWTDGKHAIYGDIYNAAKKSRAEVQVGFHIWHNNSFSPFFRAEQNYAEFAKVADYLKIVVYNNCGGPRYAGYVNSMASGILRDSAPEEVLHLNNEWLNYANEASLDKLPTAGLSADYVFRETKRALADVAGTGCKIYPGIDIDVPTEAGQKKTSPDDVYAATTAGLKAGADGVLFSRKYSEMKLVNLSAGGKAVRESV
ncbi:MAG TPA: twin-arginine translocation signal domain-containing protein [Verrucomicrobiae bacterium]|nr:twin-arginine translocation signal domain-containing protein [Verrucomicrobiae bacterium]